MTLNEIIGEIQAIGEGHKMIETVYNGPVMDALSESDLTYPVMTFDTGAGRISGSSLVFDFSFFFFDRLMQGGENEREVQSDQVEIAKDIVAQLRFPGAGYTIGDTVTVNLFTDTTPELLAGCQLALSIDIPFASDRCVVPTDYDYPND